MTWYTMGNKTKWPNQQFKKNYEFALSIEDELAKNKKNIGSYVVIYHQKNQGVFETFERAMNFYFLSVEGGTTKEGHPIVHEIQIKENRVKFIGQHVIA